MRRCFPLSPCFSPCRLSLRRKQHSRRPHARPAHSKFSAPSETNAPQHTRSTVSKNPNSSLASDAPSQQPFLSCNIVCACVDLTSCRRKKGPSQPPKVRSCSSARHVVDMIQRFVTFRQNKIVHERQAVREETGDSKYRPAVLLRKMVDAGWLGKKSGKGFYDY